MGEVVKFKKVKPGEKHKGNTLCKSGFHKWEVCPGKPFDVDKGRLITLYQCTRCGATKTGAK